MEENIRKFKLIKTYPGCLINIGEIVIKHNNSIYFPEKGGNGIDKKYVENYSEFWEEIKELPVGTKVIDTNPDTEGYTYTKQKDGKWKINNMDYYTISESSIGEGKRFRLVEKVPLFKSEDGVDMYVGDRYFRIISNWEIQEENVIQLGEHIYKNDTILRFSTKEKALEYIIENKPCLSYNDIKDIAFGFFINLNNNRTFFNKEAVIEIVKSKLKSKLK